MDIENRKEAIKYIKSQLEDGYIDLGMHDEDELRIIEEAMCALVCLEQYKWERDIAVEQLKEIGIDFGEKVNDVVKVVRCKDCKWWKGFKNGNGLCKNPTFTLDDDVVDPVTKSNDFCSYGEHIPVD